MNLKELLERRNVNDEIYLWDVHKWIGTDKPIQMAKEIKEKIMEFVCQK